MKRVVTAGTDKDKAYRDGERILKVAKELLSILDSTQGDFVEKNDLLPLYDELIDTIPAFQMAVRGKSLEF